MPEVILFKSEERKSRKDIADLLRTLADKLEENGEITLRGAEGEGVALQVPEDLVLEVKAEEETSGRGKIKRSLEIELEWREGEKSGSGGLSLE
jgi:amphi-Trp domain-containing protein